MRSEIEMTGIAYIRSELSGGASGNRQLYPLKRHASIPPKETLLTKKNRYLIVHTQSLSQTLPNASLALQS